MTEPAKKVEIKVTVEHNVAANQFETSITTGPGTSPDVFWESLKIHIVHMVKFAPYVAEPAVRDALELAAKAMKVIVLGTESSIDQIRKSQANVKKELGHG
jgi:hypothetical protein